MMKKKYSALVLAFVSVCMCFMPYAQAYTIPEGTVSIIGYSYGMLGSSSSKYTDTGERSRDESSYVSAGSGYFLKENIELGILLGAGSSSSRSDNQRYDSTRYSIGPYLTVHTPITDKSSIFYGVGAGYGQGRVNSSYTYTMSSGAPPVTSSYVSKSRYTTVFARLGWEYFFNDSSAFQLALNATRDNSKYGNSSFYSSSGNKVRSDSIDSIFGFSLFY